MKNLTVPPTKVNKISNFNIYNFNYHSFKIILFRYSNVDWEICEVGQFITKYRPDLVLDSPSNYILSPDDPQICYEISSKVIHNTDESELELKLEKTLNLYDKLCRLRSNCLTIKDYINDIIKRIFFNLSGLTTEEIITLNTYLKELKTWKTI